MEKFLLLIRMDLEKIRKETPEERHRSILEMDAWVKSLPPKARQLTGDTLVAYGNYVTRDHVMSDGPFIEAKEAVNGFIVMEAVDLAGVTEVASTCPFVRRGEMAIEIRPIPYWERP